MLTDNAKPTVQDDPGIIVAQLPTSSRRITAKLEASMIKEKYAKYKKKYILCEVSGNNVTTTGGVIYEWD